MAKTYGLNFIKIGGSYLNFPGGRIPLFGGATFDLSCSFSHSDELFQSSCVKIWFRLVEIGGMLIFGGGGAEAPYWGGGGLHATCDAHFWTWPSYFSQKSWVKIWSGLVEPSRSYRGNRRYLNFQWGQKPLLGAVTCDLQCPFSNLFELFQSKISVNIWFGLIEPFKSYRGNIQKNK